MGITKLKHVKEDSTSDRQTFYFLLGSPYFFSFLNLTLVSALCT